MSCILGYCVGLVQSNKSLKGENLSRWVTEEREGARAEIWDLRETHVIAVGFEGGGRGTVIQGLQPLLEMGVALGW